MSNIKTLKPLSQLTKEDIDHLTDEEVESYKNRTALLSLVDNNQGMIGGFTSSVAGGVSSVCNSVAQGANWVGKKAEEHDVITTAIVLVGGVIVAKMAYDYITSPSMNPATVGL